ncbi:MAG: hypothetical protein KF782_10825, partial [Labilithrix sp.]|nr:hypothetical protein [Labilithrix sp.]
MSAQAGVVVVRASSELHAPLVAHASRRLRTSGFLPVDAAVRSGAPLFREVAMHLGLAAVPVDPSACADAIGEAAAAQRAAIVAPLPADGTWDRAVASELAKNARLLVVFVTAGEPPALGDASSVFDVAAELGATDKLRWLSAIAEEAQSVLPATDLRSLEAWWAKARRVVPAAAPSFDDLDATARAVL